METKNFKNLNVKFDKNGLLRPESDVVRAVIGNILNKYPGISKGTFIMQAQQLVDTPSYGDPVDVIRFNMNNGEKRQYLGGDCGSDQVASSTLRKISAYSRSATYGAVRHSIDFPIWMDVATNSGRFIAVFCAEGANDVVMKELYLSIAKTLSMLCVHDVFLQNCINTTFRIEYENSEWADGIEKEIEDIFENNRFIEIEAWKKWRESQDADSIRREFFS